MDGSAIPAGTQGLCQDSTVGPCAAGLSCIYDMESGGKGSCFAESCCDDTTMCMTNKTLLKACAGGGTCTLTAIGYYCGK
jgi:hypothetical protein